MYNLQNKVDVIKELALAMGRKTEGIDYDSLDGEPATLFFMIAAPDWCEQYSY